MAKNKIRQAERRAIRSIYSEKLKSQFNVLNKAIKPRPKFVPMWLWAWGARIFIDVKVLQEFLEGRG